MVLLMLFKIILTTKVFLVFFTRYDIIRQIMLNGLFVTERGIQPADVFSGKRQIISRRRGNGILHD